MDGAVAPPGMKDRFFSQHAWSAPEFPLTDVHLHVGNTDAVGLSYGRLSAEQAAAMLAESGVAQACVFPPLLSSYGRANEVLRCWAAEQEPRVLPFARLRGRRGPVPVRQLWQLRRRVEMQLRPRPQDPVALDGYAGVKLAPHLDGLPSGDVLADVARLRLPVLVHAGVHCPPAWIVRHLLPKLRGPLILAHLGAFPCDARLLQEAVDLAGRHERVYLDTSAAWLAAFVRYAAERVPEKLLFGSDAPLAHPLVAWHHVASAVVDASTRERIAYRNAEALFGKPKGETA